MLELWQRIRGLLLVVTTICGIGGTGYTTMNNNATVATHNSDMGIVVNEYTKLLKRQKEFYEDQIEFLLDRIRMMKQQDRKESDEESLKIEKFSFGGTGDRTWQSQNKK